MKQTTLSNALATILVVLAVSWWGAPAMAEVSVSGPFVDTTTGGDWRGTYGQCFFLVPDSRDDMTREIIGPDWCADEVRQYRYNNCYGGVLFDHDPALSSVDWRIFKAKGDSVDLATWSTNLPILDHSAQWNPCIHDYRHTTYATGGLDSDPLTVELNLDVKGDLTLAYYFTNAATRCRELDFSLSIDGVEMSTGTIGDFAQGKYVVFDIFDLNRSPMGTTITMSAVDAPGPPRCQESDVESVNTHISGVFISGLNSAQPKSCRHLIGTHRRRAPQRPGF
jgi:hypothetical protein